MDNEINIEQIMAEIRRRVEEKKKNPVYAADLERFEREHKIYSAGDEAASDGEFLENNYDVDQPKPIFSHRPFLGGLIISAKKLLYRLVHDVFDLTIQNQVIFNFYTAKSYQNLLKKIEILEKKIKSIENLPNQQGK